MIGGWWLKQRTLFERDSGSIHPSVTSGLMACETSSVTKQRAQMTWKKWLWKHFIKEKLVHTLKTPIGIRTQEPLGMSSWHPWWRSPSRAIIVSYLRYVPFILVCMISILRYVFSLKNPFYLNSHYRLWKGLSVGLDPVYEQDEHLELLRYLLGHLLFFWYRSSGKSSAELSKVIQFRNNKCLFSRPNGFSSKFLYAGWSLLVLNA